MTVPGALSRLSASELHSLLEVAERWLARNRDAINAVNVYPVPDGDTGTNMLLTLRAALRAVADADSPPGAGEYTRLLARGALLGARGNSGVIFSQFLRGLAEGLDGVEVAGPADLVRALESGADAAYSAVSQPVEGTMLTVMRDAAAGARAGGDALASVLEAATRAAEASVERTPQLLARLREAGVVDAGGLGVAVVLQGMRFGYLGQAVPEAPLAPGGAVELDGVEHEGYGYCTEFVVLGAEIDRDALTRGLEAAGGDSVLAVGDAEAVHVHVHIEDPGPALSLGAGLGALESVKVENMQAQHVRWAAGHEAAQGYAEPTGRQAPPLGLIAVAQGAGLTAAFRELGAGDVVNGGDTMNPSAGELVEAARRTASPHVFVLPNNANVVMAAEQAARAEPDFLTVVASRTVAAGLAAAMAYLPEGDREEIAAHMREALERVRCLEVTRAVRDATLDGIAVRAGDAIVMMDGRLAARAGSLEDALLAGLAHAAGEAELVTVYLGVDAPSDALTTLGERIASAHPHVEVEVVRGDQPHYPYLVSVE